ncbi:MAG: OmpH family outer membrane protein [Myxococcota bacterium]
MKFERAALLLALGLMLGWGIGATNEPTKIGFVDAQQVLLTVKEGKSAREELERKGREAENRIAPLIQEYETKKQDFEARRMALSEDALKEKVLDLQALENRIKGMSAEEQGKLEIDQQRLVGPLQEKFIEVVREVGQENGFSAIMVSDAPSLLYRREALDITDLVIKTFDKKS